MLNATEIVQNGNEFNVVETGMHPDVAVTLGPFPTKPLAEQANEQLKEFALAVCCHDLTYQYSDDHSVWRRGQAEKDRINQLKLNLPQKVACEIWNREADRKLIKTEAPNWYWQPRYYSVIHTPSGELVEDGFDWEQNAYAWLRDASQNGRIQPTNMDEYAVELEEQTSTL